MAPGWKLRGIGITRRGGKTHGYTYAGMQAKGPKGKVVEDLGVVPKNIEKAMGKSLDSPRWTDAKFRIQRGTEYNPSGKVYTLGSKNRRSWVKD